MGRNAIVMALLLSARLVSAQEENATPPVDAGGCDIILPGPQLCSDGAIGDVGPQQFAALSKADINAIVNAAASALNVNTATIAIVDRAGRALAVFRQPGANPANDDLALGVARTTAFFSNSQAPLSSRTIRFISQVHFPPGVINASVGALYGIEQSNRGCDLNVTWNTGKCVLRARSIDASAISDKPCNAFDGSGCGAGLLTGKIQPDDAPYPQQIDDRPVRAGGIPLYRIIAPGLDRIKEGIVSNGRLLGAIGVWGINGDPQLEEFAAVTGAFGGLASGIVPLPSFPLPEPQNVFIEGFRLPFIGSDQKLKFNADGLPIGLEQPEGTSPGTTAGAFTFGPFDGGCAPNGYLVGPFAGSGGLSQKDVDDIVQRAIVASRRTRAQVRLPLGRYSRMVITVADTDGTLLAHYRMEDALFDAVDVAPAKARNMVYFNSSDPNARNDLPGIPAGTFVTGRTIGFGSQPFYPPGIDSKVFKPAPGPWFSLYTKNVTNLCSQGSQAPNKNQNGIVFFGGSTPLVRGGKLIGGLGVSGDGIEQDDYVTYLAAGDLIPPKDKWADRIKIDGARLPMFKFPRQPEGVTECGGKPCS
ncbi:MAG: hypothetical protein QOI24_3646 [Acidobacteriota bacterium]|jgi:uncharacterized protein GlcG (DUF336 family)|nr:hypothetical protein [Acidobacteriota bacterium]